MATNDRMVAGLVRVSKNGEAVSFNGVSLNALG